MKILVTGASSGIGFDAAGALARKGYEVYGAARRVDRSSVAGPQKSAHLRRKNLHIPVLRPRSAQK